MITVAAPGKLYIVGEYAVLEPGSPAVLVGVDRYVRAVLSPNDGPGPVVRRVRTGRTPTPVEFVLRGDRFEPVEPSRLDGGALAHVLAALAMVDRCAREAGLALAGFDLVIESELDDSATGRKYGLGSSGAVTVAVVRAAARAHGLDLDTRAELKVALLTVFSLDPHCSGGDVAASAHGGWVFYRTPDRAALTAALARPEQRLTTLIREPWRGLTVETLPAPASSVLEVGWVGRPATSSALVAAMRAGAAGDPARYRRFVAASGRNVERFAAACAAGDTQEARTTFEIAGGLLRALAAASGVAVENAELAALRRIATELGAVAKTSGAGGGDCGIALADPPLSPALRRRWRSAGIEPLALRASGAGPLRQEASSG
ncbi:phosphomevalonate kinase [Nocardia takedensis]